MNRIYAVFALCICVAGCQEVIRAPEASRARVLSLQFMLYNTGSIPVLLFAGVIAQLVGFNQLIGLLSASLLLFCWWGARYVRGYKETDKGK